MRRLLILLCALLPVTTWAQGSAGPGSTKAAREYAQALTNATRFGVPRYTTVALPTCNSANTGAVAFNTTSGALTTCDGSAWGAGGGSASVLPLVLDNTGAGNGVLSANKTAGNNYSLNFFRVAGTLLDAAAAGSYAVYYQIATTGTGVFDQGALQANLTAGATGTAVTTGVYGTNAVAATNAGTYLAGGGNRGGYFVATGAAGAGIYDTGVSGVASGAGLSTGVFGGATGGSTTVQNIGGAFYALNASTRNTAGLFVLGSSIVTPVTAAIDATNGSQAQPIFTARDNAAALPTTGATATWTVLDGANAQAGNMVLTSATMTAENQALMTGSAMHSYTWSNAQVVALGGTTAGDITVATLPAKTVVKNAYVVILTAAAGVTTLTVSCGDAIGGTPFINYIVASDAKAAANTIYGDAVAERGTSIDTEFFYMPSYTATTLVTCHFISTGANLSSVTTSTGRVILETSLAP